MLARIIDWIDDRFGFRRSTYPHADAVHQNFRVQSRNWFELMKRVGVLAVLAAAGARSTIANILYYISLFMIIAPIATWLEQWQLDVKTRKPTVYRPDIDGIVTTPIPPDQKPAWAYSRGLLFVSSILVILVVNFGIQSFVERVSSILASSK